MVSVALGRLVSVSRAPAAAEDDIVAAEMIESGTGRLLPDRAVDVDALGTRFGPGDVLFGKLRPYLAKVYRARGAGSAIGDLLVLSPNRHTDPDFLAYVLLSRVFLEQVNASTYGAKMPRASWDFIKTIRVIAPPLTKQRAIADFLDRETAKSDALIEKQNELVSVLRERMVAQILRGTRPTPENSDGWTKVQLRRLAFLSTGSTPTGEHAGLFDAGGGLGWVTPEDLTSDVHPWRFLTSEGGAQLRRIPPGSSLVCGIGATLGKVGFTTVHVATNQQITALIPKRNVVGRYLYFALVAERAQILGLSVGNTLPIINNARLAQLDIWIPDETSQDQLARRLQGETGKIDALIAKAEEFVALARERRAALITAAVTGQIDVMGEAS